MVEPWQGAGIQAAWTQKGPSPVLWAPTGPCRVPAELSAFPLLVDEARIQRGVPGAGVCGQDRPTALGLFRREKRLRGILETPAHFQRGDSSPWLPLPGETQVATYTL